MNTDANTPKTEQGSIHQVIDNNRALMAYLRSEAFLPLRDHPIIEEWVKGTDAFLCELAELVPLTPAQAQLTEQGYKFPRDWPTPPDEFPADLIPEVPTGSIKAFSATGQKYLVGKLIAPADNGDWSVQIILLQNFQRLNFSLREVLKDPTLEFKA